MSNGLESRWYVAQCAPRKERVAFQNLRNQGFDAYCPTVGRTKRHARRFYTVSEPLFPGYLFVGIDIGEQPWRSVNGTLGVTRLLTDGRGPVPLQDGLVDEIRAMTGERDPSVPPGKSLNIGQDVRFRQGPFTDLVGRVLSLKAGQRVEVLLRLMNREVVVGADLDDLERRMSAA
jgi:transcriptional antiterminator RfaH